MADSSWNTYTPDAPRNRVGGTVWKVAAVVVLLLVLVGSYIGLGVQLRRSSAWPILKNVTTRLGTDRLCLDLYRQNPALAESYPTEEAFLARVRDYRKGLRIPDTEPPAGPEFRSSAGPFGLNLRVRTESGTWIDLGVDFGGPFRPAPAGEGIVRLNFGADPKDLRRQRIAEMARRPAKDWARFMEVCRTLAQAEGPGELRRQAAGLRTLPAEEAAFSARANQLRTGLLAVPAAFPGSAPSRIRRNPFTRTVTVETTLQDGGRVRAFWKADALVAVELH